jgi:hypothetical protein
VAQSLYVFRSLESLVRERYRPDIAEGERWAEVLLQDVLDDIRGVAFGYFARGTARLTYRAATPVDIPRSPAWSFTVNRSNRRVFFGKQGWALLRAIQQWIAMWTEDPSKLRGGRYPSEIFIPTERSTFTRLGSTRPEVLYDPVQPQPLRTFARVLHRAGLLYDMSRRTWLQGGPDVLVPRSYPIGDVLDLGRTALQGEAYMPTSGAQLWKWRVGNENGGFNRHPIPIEAIASGQAEAWPIFVVCAVYSALREGVTFYIEEPETHLHPRALVTMVNAFVHLLKNKSKLVITTHSPYFLYALDNAILESRGDLKDSIAAYRLTRDGACYDIVDHDSGLVDAEELEEVADELGGRFEELLDEGGSAS